MHHELGNHINWNVLVAAVSPHRQEACHQECTPDSKEEELSGEAEGGKAEGEKQGGQHQAGGQGVLPGLMLCSPCCEHLIGCGVLY